MNVRDWLYVRDHCSAIDVIMREGKVGEVYNVGGNNERTNIDIVKTILKLMDKPDSLITYVADRPGHDLRYAIDSSKISAELAWRPETDFDTGMSDTINWYLNNRTWWQEILAGDYRDYYERMYGER
jgi:dTDP-glucose 4,6-dehydratase